MESFQIERELLDNNQDAGVIAPEGERVERSEAIEPEYRKHVSAWAHTRRYKRLTVELATNFVHRTWPESTHYS